MSPHQPPRILHLSYDDVNGPGKAASRLHQGMLKIGIDSHFLTRSGLFYTPNQINLHQSRQLIHQGKWKLLTLMSEATDRLLVGFSAQELFSNPWVPDWISSLKKEIQSIQPDVLYLHAINHGFVNETMLFHLGIPIFWILHSSYGFSGGCHFLLQDQCQQYEEGCKNCQIFNSFLKKRMVRNQLKKRQKLYLSPFFKGGISPSQYLLKKAQSSLLMQNKTIYHIPNPINTDIYKPLSVSFCRDFFQLPQDKILILFGSLNLEEKRKGFSIFIDTMTLLHQTFPNQIEGMVFGANAQNNSYPFQLHFMGKIYSDRELALLYNTASLTLLPSLQDNLPNIMIESLACGIPVLGFNIGGIGETLKQIDSRLIIPQKNAQSIFETLCLWIRNPLIQETIKTKACQFIHHHYQDTFIALQHQTIFQQKL